MGVAAAVKLAMAEQQQQQRTNIELQQHIEDNKQFGNQWATAAATSGARLALPCLAKCRRRVGVVWCSSLFRTDQDFGRWESPIYSTGKNH